MTHGIQEDTLIKEAVEAHAAHMVKLLASAIQDDSLYLLFAWEPANAVLTSSITDASKTRDSQQTVRSEFTGIKANLDSLNTNERTSQEADLTECIKYWLQDYLATHTAFLKFSLVAIFHANSRANTVLL